MPTVRASNSIDSLPKPNVPPVRVDLESSSVRSTCASVDHAFVPFRRDSLARRSHEPS
jgi:hypothetical protein